MNSVALITGASRGIGRGIALELAKAGWDLVVNYSRDDKAATKTAQDAIDAAQGEGKKIRAEICQADISVAGDRVRLIEFARKSFGRLDLLVNNAGIAPQVRSDLLDTSEESFDRLMNVNVRGPFFLTQLAAKMMIEHAKSLAPTAAKPKIVIVSSISAYTASVNRGEYCISKAALAMLTPLFAARLAEHGINVYEIRPGIVATDMTGPVKEKYDKLIGDGLTPIRRWGEPADIGRAVAAIAANSLPFSTGEVINVDGGFHLRTL